jgi:hypothetical protein
MKPFALITLLLALLLANFSAAITLKHSNLIPLDQIDFGAISEIVEAFENATNGEKEAALHRAVKGTILEINFLVRIESTIPCHLVDKFSCPHRRKPIPISLVITRLELSLKPSAPLREILRKPGR